MVTCETTESTSSPAVGIVLVLCACLCYSFGNCLQRYSLLRKKGERVCRCLNRHVGWLLGAFIYFSANGLYAVALSFAPVSVLAAVFSLTIITNAACSVWLLNDRVPRMAYPGYFCVLLGAIVFAVLVRAEVCHFDTDELIHVMTTPSALTFWSIMLCIIIGGSLFAFWFEKKYPIITDDNNDEGKDEVVDGADVSSKDGYSSGKVVEVGNEEDDSEKDETKNNTIDEEQPTEEVIAIEVPVEEHESSKEKEGDEENKTSLKTDEFRENEPADDVNPTTLLCARILYPMSLGTTEAVGALILKAMNSSLTTYATADGGTTSNVETSQGRALWIAMITIGVFLFVGIVLFLRLVYARFEITGAFPVEFGMLTFASVLGGFAVFQDYHYIDTVGTWVGVSLASFSIIFGILIVALASWRATLQESS